MNAKAILGVLLAVLVGVGFWFLAITPIIENTQQIEDQTASEEQRESALMGERNRLLRIQEAELQYIDAVGELEEAIPPNPNQSELINALEALATESAVVWQGATFGQPTATEDGDYNEIPINVQVSGQYFELLGYLYSMEDQGRLLRIDGASFSPSVEDNIVELSVTINATAFTTGEILTVEVAETEAAAEDAVDQAEDAVSDTEDAVDEAEDTSAETNGG